MSKFDPRPLEVGGETSFARPIEWLGEDEEDEDDPVTKYELVCPTCGQMVHVEADQIYNHEDKDHILLEECVDGRDSCPSTVKLVVEEVDMARDKMNDRNERRQKAKAARQSKAQQDPVGPPKIKTSNDVKVNLKNKDVSSQSKVDRLKGKEHKPQRIQPNLVDCPFCDPVAVGELIVVDDRPDPKLEVKEVSNEEIDSEE